MFSKKKNKKNNSVHVEKIERMKKIDQKIDAEVRIHRMPERFNKQKVDYKKNTKLSTPLFFIFIFLFIILSSVSIYFLTVDNSQKNISQEFTKFLNNIFRKKEKEVDQKTEDKNQQKEAEKENQFLLVDILKFKGDKDIFFEKLELDKLSFDLIKKEYADKVYLKDSLEDFFSFNVFDDQDELVGEVLVFENDEWVEDLLGVLSKYFNSKNLGALIKVKKGKENNWLNDLKILEKDQQDQIIEFSPSGFYLASKEEVDGDIIFEIFNKYDVLMGEIDSSQDNWTSDLIEVLINADPELEEDAPIDCGISRSLLNSDLDSVDKSAKKDEGLICLGENIINDCHETKLVLKTYNSGDLDFSLINDDGNCWAEIKYRDKKNIQMEDQKQYADKDLTCPVDVNQLRKDFDSDPDEHLGSFAASLYYQMNLSILDNEMDCIGSVLGIDSDNLGELDIASSSGLLSSTTSDDISSSTLLSDEGNDASSTDDIDTKIDSSNATTSDDISSSTLLSDEGDDAGSIDDIDTKVDPSDTANDEAVSSDDVLEKLGDKDSDRDRLLDVEEFVIGSDMSMKDTDGDGYDDLGELLNLYNPLSNGKLIDNENISLYHNQEFQYSIYYPISWQKFVVGQDSIMFKSNDKHYIQIIIQKNENNESIQDWYKMENDLDVKQIFLLKDIEAIRSKNKLVVYLTDKQKKNIFSISYSAGSNDKLIYQNIFEMMINSFELK